MFIGEYRHTIDQKRRLAIPAKFRAQLGESAVITRGIDNCLVIYPQKEWEAMAEKLGRLPASQLEARGFARIMLAGAMQVEFDQLGRILIPDYLKDYAVLKKEVVVVGIYNRLEIWDAEKWNDYKQRAEKEVGDLASKLGELGI
ncbi:MAG: cell division/cell wall cluster transcriptional repressor MraZ [Candidatus Portnoybacteria bacterium RBG_13_41_18]|uniref:Transcriptional regulator MraZ n=1 Tax=Candidatus Portnoybacteria bacterium RBG_13_41_18 TaxID=1801991 RepID=A0A1G2F906_9BACT|nr:MAG: cell division/cell wall cluster transcriptional repressor MraZ [Candidatus Portnoybacteria bacterium RBG_13_41_18]